MKEKIAIRWYALTGSKCPHDTITFMQDDRVESERIEVAQDDGMQLDARVQVLRPYTHVMCTRCSARGNMGIEGGVEAYMEGGEIQLR